MIPYQWSYGMPIIKLTKTHCYSYLFACAEAQMKDVQYTRAPYSLSKSLRLVCKIRQQSYRSQQCCGVFFFFCSRIYILHMHFSMAAALAACLEPAASVLCDRTACRLNWPSCPGSRACPGGQRACLGSLSGRPAVPVMDFPGRAVFAGMQIMDFVILTHIFSSTSRAIQADLKGKSKRFCNSQRVIFQNRGYDIWL